jgi:hypothetical protein
MNDGKEDLAKLITHYNEVIDWDKEDNKEDNKYRRIFKIPIGNCDKDKAESELSKMISDYKKDVYLGEDFEIRPNIDKSGNLYSYNIFDKIKKYFNKKD